MEYIEGTELFDLSVSLFQKGQHMEPEQIMTLIKHILLALNYIHSRGIAHRDVKPENIMYTEDRLVLIDFGFACSILENQLRKCSGLQGTPMFLSPEMWMVAYRKINRFPSEDVYLKSDIWSAGIVFYEITENVQIHQEDIDRIAQEIDKVGRGSNYSYDQIVSAAAPGISGMFVSTHPNKQISDLINDMLTVDYRQRPTAKQLLADIQFPKRMAGPEMQSEPDLLAHVTQTQKSRQRSG